MSVQSVPAGATIGILGGGQLGRMLAMSAAQLGYRCHIYAPEKDSLSITSAMEQMGERIAESKKETSRHARKFAPAGQSTQVIVGADATIDADMLATSAILYKSYSLSRVYYSAFSPIPEASKALPIKSPPLQRENRLYQADWLFRYYGFGVEEIASGGKTPTICEAAPSSTRDAPMASSEPPNRSCQNA